MKPPIDPPRPPVLDPTRARPEPWFVGSGRGLMIAVLSLVVVLSVVRGASMWLMAQDALSWWRERAPAEKPSDADGPAALPVPPPPRDPALANARLRGNPASAFSPDAYPEEALRAGEEGRVVARLLIDESGTPTSCTVTDSSDSRSLDKATCDIALARVRFQPARDGEGRPVSATYTLPVRWVLPD